MDADLHALRAALAARQKEVVSLLEELVGIATPNPPGDNYVAIVDLLRARAEQVGFAVETVHVPPAALRPYGIDGVAYPRLALIGSCGAQPGRSLHLHGHFDVVPANHADQYQPRHAGDRIYGRGTADMKGGLAAIWGALQALRDLGLAPKRRLTLTLTPDEESGGETGIGYLFRAGRLDAGQMAFMIMPECTSGDIWNASKGALVANVVVRGKAAHSTLPHLGRNAFEDMLPVAEALVALRKTVETRQSRFAVEDPRAAFSTLALGGQMAGGEKFNIIPGHCHFTLDRRPIPEESLAEARAELFAVRDTMRAGGLDVEFEVWLEAAPALTEPDEPGCRALAQALREVSGRPARFLLCPGFLDIRHFTARGVPAVACGPGRLEVAHGPDEHVTEAELLDYMQALAMTLLRF